jgi:hypothetical protein
MIEQTTIEYAVIIQTSSKKITLAMAAWWRFLPHLEVRSANSSAAIATFAAFATQGDIPQNINFAIKGSVAATFLESYSVSFKVGSETTAMAPADLAAHAKSLSVFVDCK